MSFTNVDSSKEIISIELYDLAIVIKALENSSLPSALDGYELLYDDNEEVPIQLSFTMSETAMDSNGFVVGREYCTFKFPIYSREYFNVPLNEKRLNKEEDHKYVVRFDSDSLEMELDHPKEEIYSIEELEVAESYFPTDEDEWYQEWLAVSEEVFQIISQYKWFFDHVDGWYINTKQREYVNI